MTETRLLVTGATGYIGRQVLPLVGHDVVLHVVSTHTSALVPSQAITHLGDLRDPDTCRRLVDDVRPTHLLHLAWSTQHGAFWSDVGNVDWLVAGIALLQSFARCGGQRVVVAGTCAEYAPTAMSPLCELTTPLDPNSLYGAMKVNLFKAASALAEQYGFSLAWPRLFHSYGEGENPARLVPSTIKALLAGTPVRCANPGFLMDLMNVRDLGAAIYQLLLCDISGPINLGSGERVRVMDVVALLEELVSGKAQLREESGMTTSALIPDLVRMREELSFTPRISLRGGLADALAWWRTQAS